mmetsp:Transcript_105589/g.187782  ORF Transcript_105589/g.187782 Transcript_105589/m.187782 type:complete len:221 (+) Transcript_105589:145-807(+)
MLHGGCPLREAERAMIRAVVATCNCHVDSSHGIFPGLHPLPNGPLHGLRVFLIAGRPLPFVLVGTLLHEGLELHLSVTEEIVVRTMLAREVQQANLLAVKPTFRISIGFEVPCHIGQLVGLPVVLDRHTCPTTEEVRGEEILFRCRGSIVTVVIGILQSCFHIQVRLLTRFQDHDTSIDSSSSLACGSIEVRVPVPDVSRRLFDVAAKNGSRRCEGEEIV